ncbi:hypothetical protein CHS0354_039488 [Potamilus streckersoni]|uniref:Uncharacterized protein n=1 Tax=Potamilus streckersoni TaxID=2493646 RepID=A0AAE0TKR7_9BIVA|nr:hypothetical protein CHS0354_039488 [Potamilus streckersoni]
MASKYLEEIYKLQEVLDDLGMVDDMLVRTEHGCYSTPLIDDGKQFKAGEGPIKGLYQRRKEEKEDYEENEQIKTYNTKVLKEEENEKKKKEETDKEEKEKEHEEKGNCVAK